jgi:hypothetical protein
MATFPGNFLTNWIDQAEGKPAGAAIVRLQRPMATDNNPTCCRGEAPSGRDALPPGMLASPDTRA